MVDIRPAPLSVGRTVAVLAAATLAHAVGHLVAWRWAIGAVSDCIEGCDAGESFGIAFMYLGIALPLAHIVGSGLLDAGLGRAFADRAVGRTAVDLATPWWFVGSAVSVPAFVVAVLSTSGIVFVVWLGSVILVPVACAVGAAIAAARGHAPRSWAARWRVIRSAFRVLVRIVNPRRFTFRTKVPRHAPGHRPLAVRLRRPGG